jgi:hypothetical protein
MRAIEDRICPILIFPLPKTKTIEVILVGVTGYCKIWILGYADLARPLYQILKEVQKDPQPSIKWEDRSKKYILPVLKVPYDSSCSGSPSTRQVSIICL